MDKIKEVFAKVDKWGYEPVCMGKGEALTALLVIFIIGVWIG